MNTNELIVNAYYLSDIVSRELKQVSGSQLADGLRLLNGILSEKSAKGYEIPYYTDTEFDTVIGQEEYFVQGLLDTSTVTFNIDNVRYSMYRVNRKRYAGSSRVDGITSLPYTYYVERALHGTNLFLYDLPAGEYLVKVKGKFSLSRLTGGEDLSNTQDDYYVDYLEYALANRICDFYNIELSPGKMRTLMKKERDIFQVATPDMKIRKVSTLKTRQPYQNYGWANLSNGWVPGE